MSRFLYHTSCPRCGSRDNVAVYDDGHGWCFGCRAVVIEPEHRLVRERKKSVLNESRGSSSPTSSLSLPSDYTIEIPIEGLLWLEKYTLTPREIQQHRFGWSTAGWKIRKKTDNPIDYAPLMIFPVYDVFGNLLMYQARYFGSRNDCPKYWTVGARDVVHTIGDSDTCTLVEDLVSAIKVGRFTTGVPIFGSDIDIGLVVKLYNRYKNLNIWLDKDKRKYAHERMQSIRYMFNACRVIDSELDPKEYTNEELRKFLVV